jgi:hypothetical protein
MTSTALRSRGAISRRAAWILTLSPLLFVLWLLAVVATLSGSGVTDSADLSVAQMDAIRTGWRLIWPVYAAAIIVGSAAMMLLRLSLAARVASAVSIVAALANLVLSELAAGFTEPRLGDNGYFTASLVASYAAIWAALVALIVTGVVLRRTGMLRRTGLVIAVLAGLFLVLDVVTRGLPPFIVAPLWLAVGIALLRRRVTSPA